MKRIRVFLLLCSLACLARAAGQDSTRCGLRISVLTCAPGQELYSTFGHTALRVIDSLNGTDYVFNYGTFDFGDPGFYMKFVKGRLDYFLSAEQMSDFVYTYEHEQRSILEQELALSCTEKQQLYEAVRRNLEGANRFYRYDFLYDNCTTRVRDLLKRLQGGFVVSDSLVASGTSARDLLYEYLDKGGKPWSKLGIDILLGSRLDKPVTSEQAMFLPDYLMKGLDHASHNGTPLVFSKGTIFDARDESNASWTYMPLLLFSLIAAAVFLLSARRNQNRSGLLRVIDSLLFYLTGLTGFLLLFMWFGTDHKVCQYNWNLAWALPTHFIAAFFLWKKNRLVRGYFRFTAIACGLLLLSWPFLPQHLNISLVPVVILLMYRSFVNAKQ